MRKAQTQNRNFFLQDGDPRQNSKKAKVGLDSIGAEIFSIPSRCPDMNPIENIFNITTKEILHSDTFSKNITNKNFEEYSKRIKETLHSLPLETINKTIESMPIRMGLIVKGKGMRKRY